MSHPQGGFDVADTPRDGEDAALLIFYVGFLQGGTPRHVWNENRRPAGQPSHALATTSIQVRIGSAPLLLIPACFHPGILLIWCSRPTRARRSWPARPAPSTSASGWRAARVPRRTNNEISLSIFRCTVTNSPTSEQLSREICMNNQKTTPDCFSLELINIAAARVQTRPALLRIALCMAVVLGLASTASAQIYAGPGELSNCTIPTRILISNSASPFSWGIKRYVQYPGGSLTEMQPPPGYSTGKNWRRSPDSGPGQVQNCSNGGPGGTQWLTFRLKTTNYFSSAVGSGTGAHLIFGLRFFDSVKPDGSPAYDGIGMILMPQYGGMLGERFRFGMDGPVGGVFSVPASQIPLQDGVEYAVNIHAAADYTSFSLTNVITGATTGFVGGPNSLIGYPVVNTGLAFAVLCSGDIGPTSCENWNATPWSVDISSIGSGWF